MEPGGKGSGKARTGIRNGVVFCETAENDPARLRALFKDLDPDTRWVVLRLHDAAYLREGRRADFPPGVNAVSVAWEEAPRPRAAIVDVHGRSLTGPDPAPGPPLPPKEDVESFAQRLQPLSFKFKAGIPWDTTVTYTAAEGWRSEYLP